MSPTTPHPHGNAAMAKALAGILAISLAACGKSPDDAPAPAPSSMGDVIDNTVVTARIKSALMANPRINSYDFKVETRNGEVLLSGFVDTQEQLDLALKTVRAVDGVGTIQNKVVLKGAGATVGNKVDDGVITARVKAALLADPGIHSLDIRVVTRIDEVQLSGFVDNQAQIDHAIDLTQAIPGVRAVANKMAIKK
jgi:hyperosmotically inducible periplasmic protein